MCVLNLFCLFTFIYLSTILVYLSSETGRKNCTPLLTFTTTQILSHLHDITDMEHAATPKFALASSYRIELEAEINDLLLIIDSIQAKHGSALNTPNDRKQSSHEWLLDFTQSSVATLQVHLAELHTKENELEKRVGKLREAHEELNTLLHLAVVYSNPSV